jgi:hypothetical protein
MESERTFLGLKRFNLAMFLLHLGQGIVMLIVSSDFTLPVTTSYLKFDAAAQKLVSNPQNWFELKIGPAVAVFLFLSAIAHLFVGTVFNDWYNKNLAKGINYARWVEYAFSSSVMIVIIAMLVGIYDVSALIPIFIVNASMILFGWMMELHNQSLREAQGKPQVNWTSFIMGCIAGVAPWIVIALYLASPGSESNPPTFVYWIFFSIFIFFNCFAINQVLQYKKIGPWKEYIYGERVYIILSLVAKSLLAWQVFAGTLRP